MKIFRFLKSRATYYLVFIVACLFLYLIIPNSTFLGIIIGLFVSEIQTFLDFQDRITSTKQNNSTISDLDLIDYPTVKFNWKRLIIYVLIVLAIWIISNLYLHFTIK